MSTLITTRPPAMPRQLCTAVPTRKSSSLQSAPPAVRRPTRSFQWDLRIDESPSEIEDIEESLNATNREHSTDFLVSSELPDAESWAKALTRGIIEVLLGLRPIGQLRRWVVHPLFTRLEERRQIWTGTAPYCSVRSVHSTPITHSTVELALIVSIDQHVVAVALRLEACRYHWMATALDIV